MRKPSCRRLSGRVLAETMIMAEVGEQGRILQLGEDPRGAFR